MSLRWVITGGGTGGHVTPALALGEVLRDHGDAVLFVGTTRGIERRLVPEAGFELEMLASRPLVGRSPLERLRGVIALLRCTWQARGLLKRFAPDRVISVGGYASAPAALAAALARIPMVLVNPDVSAGAANRLLARFATRIFVGFDTPASLARFAERVEVSGVPLRRALRDAFQEASAAPGAREGGPSLFVFGGSQGARQINEGMMAALPTIAAGHPDLRVVHQTGEADRERVAEAYEAAGVDAEVVAFERDMPARYAAADLVVCRAGAISVAELTLAGRASLLVPLAHVGGGEQFANAKVLADAGAARVIDSREFDAEVFAKEVGALLAAPDELARMAEAARGLARPAAADAIVARCRELEAAS